MSDKGSGGGSAGAGIPADEDVGAWLRDREVGGLAPADLPVLFGLDPAGLGQGARLSLLVLLERARGMCEAAVQPVLVALDDRAECPLLPVSVEGGFVGVEEDWVAEEIAAALTLSPVSARDRLGRARWWCGAARPALDALAAGRLGVLQALAAVEETTVLPEVTATAVLAGLLADPVTATLTPGRFRARLAAAVLAADPAAADARHRAARARRGLCRVAAVDGMATLAAYLPAAQAGAVWERLTAAAWAEKTRRRAAAAAAGARYTGPGVGQLRADLLVAWITGHTTTGQATGQATEQAMEPAAEPAAEPAVGAKGGPGGRSGWVGVQVVIDLPTLLGLAEHPGELVGHGPIPPGLARMLAADGAWRRLVFDPLTGQTLDLGRRSYVPSAALRAFVIARDRVCLFPGCARSAYRCDLDHRQAWAAGGCTDRDNLIPLCRRHHRLKTHSRWRITAHADGVVSWRSPAGRCYLSRAHDYRTGPPPGHGPPHPHGPDHQDGMDGMDGMDGPGEQLSDAALKAELAAGIHAEHAAEQADQHEAQLEAAEREAADREAEREAEPAAEQAAQARAAPPSRDLPDEPPF